MQERSEVSMIPSSSALFPMFPRNMFQDYQQLDPVTMARGYLGYDFPDGVANFPFRPSSFCYNAMLSGLGSNFDSVKPRSNVPNWFSRDRTSPVQDKSGRNFDNSAKSAGKEGAHPSQSLTFEESFSGYRRNEHRTDFDMELSPRSTTSSDVNIENNDLKKSFTCPQCKYVTDRKNNLKRHIMTMHLDCDRNLECCNVTFRSKASLREHVNLFHKNGYRCGTCGRNFCRKALLRRHLTVHSGRKDFHCTMCDYATSHKSNLERHQKVHAKGPLSMRATWKTFRRLAFLHRPNQPPGFDHTKFRPPRLKKLGYIKDHSVRSFKTKFRLLTDRIQQTHEELTRADVCLGDWILPGREEQTGDSQDGNGSRCFAADMDIFERNVSKPDSADVGKGLDTTNFSNSENCVTTVTKESNDMLAECENKSALSVELEKSMTESPTISNIVRKKVSSRLCMKPYRCSQCHNVFSSQNFMNNHQCSNEVGKEMFSVVALLSKSQVNHRSAADVTMPNNV